MYEAIYRESQQRTVGLATGLTEEELARQVPACPEWTVRLLVAHLAGVSADVANNRMDGGPGEAWIARHIAERADRPVLDNLAEWSAHAERIETVPAFLAMDTLVHEADLRAALGRERLPDAAWQTTLAGLVKRLPGLRVITESGQLSDGETTVRVSGYELWRAFFGRRSRAQLEAWDWTGDREPFLAKLPVFGPRDTDLTD